MNLLNCFLQKYCLGLKKLIFQNRVLHLVFYCAVEALTHTNYINMNDNVNYILTTHYHNLCKKLKNEKTKNYHMSITETQDDFNFTYKLKKGICNFKGGIKIFKELEYPSTIINSIKSNNI